MPLQGIMVEKKIPVADAVYNYHDSLQVHLINGISHSSSQAYDLLCGVLSKQLCQNICCKIEMTFYLPLCNKQNSQTLRNKKLNYIITKSSL